MEPSKIYDNLNGFRQTYQRETKKNQEKLNVIDRNKKAYGHQKKSKKI